ncbi:extracellular solute-binding protein [Listeria booriae]|uniref:Extracellular solute-binding protein n=1 Tax=Listeria booriae TaxID=1552123 RepID=A0A842EUK3_9LIST|nr:extracellular solute-binding protein [Listeria booriae]MBC2242810.1 extracellular solute-binding protein [Listeria booriae]
MMLKARLMKRFLVVMMIASIVQTPSVFSVAATNDTTYEKVETSSENAIMEPAYEQVLASWKQSVKDAEFYTNEVMPSAFKKAALTVNNHGYEQREVAMLADGSSVTLDVTVPSDGLYTIGFDYFKLNDGLINPEFSIAVAGKFPFYESRRIIAPTIWKNKTANFETNKYGNELIPEQVAVAKWQTGIAEDPNYFEGQPLQYLLKKGTNRLTLTNTAGAMLLGSVRVEAPVVTPDYVDYQKEYVGAGTPRELLTYEAEQPKTKNNSYTRPVAKKDISVEPYDTKRLLLNTLGGDSWQSSGQSVTYAVKVPKSGNYQLSFKVLQEDKPNSPVFRTVKVDGVIPFAELAHYRFDPTSTWENQTLSGKNGKPFEIYLEEGKHDLTLVADASPVAPIILDLKNMMLEVGDLGLSVKKLTGNQPDAARDWKLEEYLPNVTKQFDGWIRTLKEDQKRLTKVYGESAKRSTEGVSLALIIDKLKKLKAEPDKIPTRLSELSEGSSSVTQSLGDLQSTLEKQPLLMDRFYVHDGKANLPKAKASFLKKFGSKSKEFFASFTQDTYSTTDVDADTIEVWVSRSQQYVELMQNMADSTFTKETGKKVKFSVMPNEQKLILANSGNQQPDVALGVSVGTPYELAIRGAATDLTQFSDFKKVIQDFSPGAFMPMMVDNKVYALPETQDFYVQFYRKDILDKLKIPVPDTWNDVTGILPELQRNGLSYFVPLSGSAGSKPFMFTAPFIYQFGGDLYADDGMSAAIDSEESVAGLKFMTDLYSLYSVPLQVPNFYHSFRYGTLPVGISNFETYVKLMSAAPEIANSWDISVHPGVSQQDGSIARWATGSGQSAMIFDKSEKQDASWELLKWWMSTKTQSDFATNLQTIYGPEYMWNTANLEAFKELPWPEKHKTVILEQWKYLKEVPKTPGSYMLEREISNVWTDTVFYGANIRAAVDSSSIIVDREIRRKMEEFGYMKDGKVVKPYIVPQIETVEDWMKTDEKK